MKKGILIDAVNRTIKEVELGDSYKDIYPLINCDCFTCVDVDGKNTCYVDDEGLLKNPKDFFLWKGYPGALAGNGLILGTNEEGESVDATISLEEVKKKVKFADYLTVSLLAKTGAFA